MLNDTIRDVYAHATSGRRQSGMGGVTKLREQRQSIAQAEGPRACTLAHNEDSMITIVHSKCKRVCSTRLPIHAEESKRS